jgi:hypothetical protein
MFMMARMGTKRKEMYTLQTPGPGAYDPNIDVVKSKNPTAKITKGRKGISSKDLSPGPGAYDGLSKEFGKNSTSITFKGRPSTAKAHNTPGPGAYDANISAIKDKVRNVGFGKT